MKQFLKSIIMYAVATSFLATPSFAGQNGNGDTRSKKTVAEATQYAEPVKSPKTVKAIKSPKTAEPVKSPKPVKAVSKFKSVKPTKPDVASATNDIEKSVIPSARKHTVLKKIAATPDPAKRVAKSKAKSASDTPSVKNQLPPPPPLPKPQADIPNAPQASGADPAATVATEKTLDNTHKLKDGERELIPFRVLRSRYSRASDAIKGMFASFAYMPVAGSLIKANQDLDKVENTEFTSAIRRTGDFTKIAPKKAGEFDVFLFQRYEEGDPRTTDMLIESGKINDVTMLLVDSNGVFSSAFPDGNSVNEFNGGKVQLLKNPKAVEMKRLLDDGFELLGADNKFTEKQKLQLAQGKKFKLIAMQPLWNAKKIGEIPIQHEKQAWYGRMTKSWEVLLSFTSSSSTHNHTLPKSESSDPDVAGAIYSRSNLLTIYQDPIIMDHTAQHLMAAADALGDGKAINDIVSLQPLQAQYYKDGEDPATAETITVEHTDGRMNPNRMGTDFIQFAALHPDQIAITKIEYSQFVNTFRDENNALRNVMKAQQGTHVLALFDNQFIDPRGYGFSAALAGMFVIPPHGAPFFPFGKEALARMDVYAYQRVIKGESVSDVDGAPEAQVLDHEKLRIVDYTKSGASPQNRVLIQLGSLNLSGHYQSEERQDHIDVHADSLIAITLHDHVEQLIDTEKKAGFAIPMADAVLRGSIAHFLGRSVFEISLDQLAVIKQLLGNSQQDTATFDKIGQIILDLFDKQTAVKGASAKAVVEANVAMLKKFGLFYYHSAQNKSSFSLSNFALIEPILVHPDASPEMIRTALEHFVNSSGQMHPDQVEINLQSLWTALEIKAPLPAPYDPNAPKKQSSNTDLEARGKIPGEETNGILAKAGFAKPSCKEVLASGAPYASGP